MRKPDDVAEDEAEDLGMFTGELVATGRRCLACAQEYAFTPDEPHECRP